MQDSADASKLIFAWCFSHGRLHLFTSEAEPWCTATWVILVGADRDDALADKQQRFGDAAFLHQLPGTDQLAIIEEGRQRDVSTGRRTPKS
ncbi:hypothetical protein ACFQ6C_26310 [Streptomyces sp. NPDC056454]|uniref:hypothetical protein n=1 Tax=Streptomyces sp. NPDC056454 TaxID=3345823 RepID=UPI0036A30927